MKKINTFLIVILLLSITTSIVVAYTKNIPDEKIVKEEEKSTNKDIIDSNEVKIIDFKLEDGSVVKLNYLKTAVDINGEYTQLLYTDSDGSEYTFDKYSKKLKCISYNNEVLLKPGSPKHELEDIKSIAEKNISKFIRISDYSFNKHKYYEKGDHFKYYQLVWEKTINGIPTSDEIIAKVGVNGDMLSLVIPNEGLYKQNDEALRGLTENYMSKEKAIEILNQIVKEQEGNNHIGTYESYSIDEATLYFNKEKKLVWNFLVGVIIRDANQEGIVIGRTVTIDANTGEVTYK